MEIHCRLWSDGYQRSLVDFHIVEILWLVFNYIFRVIKISDNNNFCFLIKKKKLFSVYSPLPESFSEERQLAQLDRIRKLDINPIWGINKRT